MANNKNFKLPKQVINQLSECCSAGFLLVYTDDKGDVKHLMMADHQMAALGIISYTNYLLEFINEVEVTGMVNNFCNPTEEDTLDSDDSENP